MMASRLVVLFSKANLTSYYLPYLIELEPGRVQGALDPCRGAAREEGLWVIAGTIRKTADRFLNLAHVINPDGRVAHEYSKVHMGAAMRCAIAGAATSSPC